MYEHKTEEITMLSEQEIQWNLKCAKNAIAQQRLEGLEPSTEGISDLERAARGETSFDELMENTRQRYGNGKILEQRPLS
jgi:hypothetical protein